MPYLKVETNVHIGEGSQAQILKVLSKTTSEALSKPESYVMVALHENIHMMFAGTDDPAAYLEFKSLGLPETNTTEFSAALCNAIEQELGIAKERIYIEFAGPERHMWGWNGKTF